MPAFDYTTPKAGYWHKYKYDIQVPAAGCNFTSTTADMEENFGLQDD